MRNQEIVWEGWRKLMEAGNRLVVEAGSEGLCMGETAFVSKDLEEPQVGEKHRRV